MNCPYKLIALDLDGTLVRSDQCISQRTVDTLIRVQEMGVKVAVASGAKNAAVLIDNAVREADSRTSKARNDAAAGQSSPMSAGDRGIPSRHRARARRPL